jgi:VCBS repeat-containing protein
MLRVTDEAADVFRFNAGEKHTSLFDSSPDVFRFGAEQGATNVDVVAPAGNAVAIPDAHFLFSADFKRKGQDLVLTGDDDRKIVVQDYFKTDIRPTLLSPNGASLTGSVVEILAGSELPGQYAQAAAAAAAAEKPIGRVERVTGSATVTRTNGVTVELKVGDVLYRGDVVQTARDSTLAASLADGTIFDLFANARMVLNEFVYDQNATSNSALMSLVQGSVGFLAGKLAKSGEMLVETPVATMGIRGTATLTEITAVDGTTSFSVLTEPDQTVGSYNLYEKTTRTLLATVDQAGVLTLVSPAALGQSPAIAQQQMNLAQLQFAQQVVQELFQIFTQFQTNPFNPDQSGVNPRSGPGGGGSLNPLLDPQIQFNDIPAGLLANLQASGTAIITVTNAAGEEEEITIIFDSTIIVAPVIGGAVEDGDTDTQDALDNIIGGEGLVLTITNVPDPLPPGVSRIPGTNQFTLDPTDPFYDRLRAGQQLVVEVNYGITDGITTVPAKISWTVVGVNDLPVVEGSTNPDSQQELPDASAQDIGGVSGTITASDADFGDALTGVVAADGVATLNGGPLPAGIDLSALTAATTIKFDVAITDGGSKVLNWTYDPVADLDFLRAGQMLTIEFIAQVTDGLANVGNQILTITVIGTNDAPVIVGATNPATVAEASDSSHQDIPAISGALTASDKDIGDSLTGFVGADGIAKLNGGALPGGVDLAALVAADTISFDTVTTDGGAKELTWTYDPAAANLEFLGANDVLTIEFTAQVNDGFGNVGNQVLIITVGGANDAPVIVDSSNPDAVTEALDASAQNIPAISGTLTANDEDIGDSLTGFVGANGIAKLNGGAVPAGVNLAALVAADTISFDTQTTDGGEKVLTWTYDPAAANLDFLRGTDVLTIEFTAQVNDGFGNVDDEILIVTVNGTNDAPVIVTSTDPDAVTEALDASAQNIPAISGTLTASDKDIGDSLTGLVSANGIAKVNGGALPAGVDLAALVAASTISFSTVTTDGGAKVLTWTYDPAAANLDFLRAGDVLTVEFTAKVNDGSGPVGSETLTITINGSNDPPAGHGKTVTVLEDNTYTFQVADFGFTDPLDNPDNVFIEVLVTTAPDEGVLKNGATVLGAGALVSVADIIAGNFTFRPAQDAHGLAYTSFTFQVRDDGGDDSTDPTPNVMTINVTPVDDPTQGGGNIALFVKEEALDLFADAGPAPADLHAGVVIGSVPLSRDETDQASGGIVFTAGDDAITITFADPAIPGSGWSPPDVDGLAAGYSIAWRLDAGSGQLIGTLIGPGASNLGDAIFLALSGETSAGVFETATPTVTATLADQLQHAVIAGKNDVTIEGLTVVATDATDAKAFATVDLTVTDDVPVANPSFNEASESAGVDTNIMLIIDVSGSMNDASGVAGLTRLDLLKASVSDLLERYDNDGSVAVRIVTFSSNASAQGSGWLTIEQAQAIINGLTAGGGTDYDAAVAAATSAFATAGKISGAQNVSYFFSDGEPTEGGGITGGEVTSWQNFLNTNDINSFAIGVGAGAVVGTLNPIAYDGRGTGTDRNGTVVTDLAQLPAALLDTVGEVDPVESTVLISGTPENTFGADGGYVKSITFNGVTYTYDPAAGGSISVSGGPSSGTFSTANNILTITSAIYGTLAIDMDDAAYTFTPPISVPQTQDAVYEYTLIDNDGDTSTNTLTITVFNVDKPPMVHDDRVITNVSGGDGTTIVIPDFALLYNDVDPDGQPIVVTAVGTATNGSVADVPAGSVTFTDNNTNGGSFNYTGTTTTDPVAANDAIVTVNRAQAGQTQLDGTGLDDILIGRNGVADTILGNAGDDVLIGGDAGGAGTPATFTLTADGPDTSGNGDFLQFRFTGGSAGDFVQSITINLRGGSDGDAIYDGTDGASRTDGEWGPDLSNANGLDIAPPGTDISFSSTDNVGSLTINFVAGSFGVGDGFDLNIDVDNLGSGVNDGDAFRFAERGVTATIVLQDGRTQTVTFGAVDGDTSLASFVLGDNDLLDGGAGNDLLFGGGGADTFKFTGSNFGDDTVLDFQDGDVIEIDTAVFGSFATLIMTADGPDTVIHTLGDTSTITLKNVALGTLSAADFHFV